MSLFPCRWETGYDESSWHYPTSGNGGWRETLPEAGTTLAGQGSRQVNAMCHRGRGDLSYDLSKSVGTRHEGQKGRPHGIS